MSRLRRAIHGVTTGYLLLAATALYALGSVPIALHYLDGERFGLWALLASLIGYLSMIDLGMSASISRYLIDVKDDRKSGNYGVVIKTGWVVMLAQAAILVAIGILGAGTFSRWMDIPAHLIRPFQIMVWLQCGVIAFNFWARMFHCLLVAHQRMDIANYGGIVSLIINFFALWIFFQLGAGVYSLIFAGFAGSVIGTAYHAAWCYRLELLPQKNTSGWASRVVFREMFNYGRDVFLVAFGSQLILASQTIIITRMIGLDAAAAWSIATRTFTLVGQAVWRVAHTSLSALAEMLVREERDRLHDRYPSLAKLANSLAAYCAVAFALCNSAFVSFWTAGRISWSPFYDVLLGVWLIVLTWLNTNGNLVIATKRIHFMKYVYFVEGLVFIASSILSMKTYGIGGMLVCSIACSILFSGIYNAWRVSELFNVSLRTVYFGWWKNGGFVLVVFGTLAAVAAWAIGDLGAGSKLSLGVGISLFVGFPLFLRLGVPDVLKSEVILRVPRRLAPLAGRAFGCAK